MTSMYCEHNRTAAACEDCAYARALARGVRVEGPAPAETRAAAAAIVHLEPVAEDTLVDTGDEGRTVLVVAGDTIPAELRDKPSRPRRPTAKTR